MPFFNKFRSKTGFCSPSSPLSLSFGWLSLDKNINDKGKILTTPWRHFNDRYLLAISAELPDSFKMQHQDQI